MFNGILEKVYLASLKFLTPLSLDETYKTIVEEAVNLVKAEWGSVILEENNELVRVFSSNPKLYQVKIRKRGFMYKSFKSGKPMVLRGEDIAKVHPEIGKLGVVSDVTIPLSYQSKSIGILTLLSKKEESFNDEEVRSLILFGSMASLVIQKNRLYHQTEKALKERDLFISMASHELKTPVTTIYGYAQMMMENKLKGKEIKIDWISSLNAECSRIKLLIYDLLEINKIRSGKIQYNFKECSVLEIINRVINNISFNYPGRKILFNNKLKEGEDIVIGDFDRLMQVIVNLLDNAAKFSDKDKGILIIISKNVKSIVIEIKDCGIGIDKKDINKIFNRFYRGTGVQHEGLGLGLYLVRNIIQRHHGTIKINSKKNQGTAVEINLPKIKV